MIKKILKVLLIFIVFFLIDGNSSYGSLKDTAIYASIYNDKNYEDIKNEDKPTVWKKDVLKDLQGIYGEQIDRITEKMVIKTRIRIDYGESDGNFYGIRIRRKPKRTDNWKLYRTATRR